MSRPLTVGSLFAGIGGFDLGFERAGFEIKWQVEIDPFCRKVLAKHWPDVRRYDDVRTTHAIMAHSERDGRPGRCVGTHAGAALCTTSEAQGEESTARGITDAVIDRRADAACSDCLPTVDVICGGFPCQPHSLAGRRGGSEDDRDLWPQFARLICELRPRWVVAENVPGLLSSESGRFFGAVLGDLAACGYDAEWDCVPAAAVGANHRRDRVWIVAYPSKLQFQPESSARLYHAGHCGARPLPRRSETSTLLVEEIKGDVADAASLQRTRRSRDMVPNREGRMGSSVGRAVMEFANGQGCQHASEGDEGARIFRQGQRIDPTVAGAGWWDVEPNVGRVAYGIPARVDRLRGLGNAIVPQIAEWIAHRIKEAEGLNV